MGSLHNTFILDGRVRRWDERATGRGEPVIYCDLHRPKPRDLADGEDPWAVTQFVSIAIVGEAAKRWREDGKPAGETLCRCVGHIELRFPPRQDKYAPVAPVIDLVVDMMEVVE